MNTPPPPRYNLGQNFLINPNTISAIADAAAINAHSITLELGIGRGALTRELCSRAEQVFGIEKDRRLVEWAEANSIYPANLEVIVADMLDFDFEAFAEKAGARRAAPLLNITGNLPYNISSQIVVKIIKIRHVIDRATLMFQKEVADRLTAEPGSKQYGALSVQAGYCFHMNKIMDVSPGQFRPRPKVMSTVISFVPKQPDIQVNDFNLFRKVVKAAFLNRRKKMFNSLKRNLDIDRNILKTCMEHVGISPDARAETIDINTFAKLSNALHGSGNGDDRNRCCIQLYPC